MIKTRLKMIKTRLRMIKTRLRMIKTRLKMIKTRFQVSWNLISQLLTAPSNRTKIYKYTNWCSREAKSFQKMWITAQAAWVKQNQHRREKPVICENLYINIYK
jgi:hypothetical protein